MIFSFVYDFGFCLLMLLYSPKAAYDYFFRSKYKKSLKSRLGMDFPKIDKKDKPLAWIHAVSVGETRAVAPLAKQLDANYTLLVTSITETGHEEAKRSVPFADYHLFLPIDLKAVIEPIVAEVKPALVIVVETDLWYQFLRAAKKFGAKIFLVNGKVSEKSEKRLKMAPFFTKKLYNLVDFFAVQSDIYKERFLALNVPPAIIAVTGNLKFDHEEKPLSEQELISWKERFGISPHQKVITAGSTHDGEEKLILDAVQEISTQHPNLKIILVPRHPERFAQIEKELISRKVPFSTYSKSEKCSHNILLIDAMGLLRRCYQVSDLAIVGGSFWPKVGGHNILEPLYTGVPVLFGPYMHSQPTLLELVNAFSAGLQVDKNDLSKTLHSLLTDPEKSSSLKNNGLKLISSLHGSTKRTLQLIQKSL